MVLFALSIHARSWFDIKVNLLTAQAQAEAVELHHEVVDVSHPVEDFFSYGA